MPFHELDTVVVTEDIPALGLRRGDVGAVVQAYPEGGLEVEFVTATGSTQAVVTLSQESVRPIGSRDLLAVRPLDIA